LSVLPPGRSGAGGDAMSPINMDIEYPRAMRRIAELKAENSSMADDICSLTTAHERAERAEAELVARKAERCSTCERLGSCKVHHEAVYYGWDNNHGFACIRWTRGATP